MLTVQQIKDAQDWLDNQRAVRTEIIRTVRDALDIGMRQAEHREAEAAKDIYDRRDENGNIPNHAY